MQGGDGEDDEDDKSDEEDFKIKSTDNLLLVGHVEGNASILEVYGQFLVLLVHFLFANSSSDPHNQTSVLKQRRIYVCNSKFELLNSLFTYLG